MLSWKRRRKKKMMMMMRKRMKGKVQRRPHGVELVSEQFQGPSIIPQQ
jgi:hypothetical protein